MPTTPLQRILYIEDDEALARLLQKRMERNNLTVDTAFSAEEGMRQIRQNTYDLVLLDQELPGMSGLEMLSNLLHFKGTPPVIVLTASGDERVAIEALEKGATDYVLKDVGLAYIDLLPAVMHAAFTRERLLRVNEQQRQELIVAKEKAEAASTAKTNFLANMSHEIRTPMNVVSGLTHLLRKTSLSEQQTKIVETLQSNADILLHLINDLLDVSRIEAGQFALENSQFSVGALLQDLKNIFAQQVDEKSLAYESLDATDDATFVGDRMRIQQILMNIVGNAIKFTERGHIKITACMGIPGHKDKGLTFTVEDSGIGIPGEKLPNIFEKFMQADASITRRFGGSGLGLAIARSLATLMDGDILLTSELGRGSTFTIFLPLLASYSAVAPIRAQQDQAAAAPPRPVSTATSTQKILIVEDYAPNIMVASLMLEEIGYQYEAVENGFKAIEALGHATEPFYAILMDVQMQGIDGLETTRRIRALEDKLGRRNFIIGVTAHALAGDHERCLSAGMDDYICKPIHPDILANKLKAIRARAA